MKGIGMRIMTVAATEVMHGVITSIGGTMMMMMSSNDNQTTHGYKYRYIPQKKPRSFPGLFL